MPASSGAIPTDAAGLARSGGRDALSLALIDARNRSLRWLSLFEEAQLLRGTGGTSPVPLHMAGRAGWLQEWWIICNVRRLQGEAARAGGLRLPGVDPRFDAVFSDHAGTQVRDQVPDADTVRGYLQTTLEQTLDLLLGTAETDDALHVYRLALQHEDRLAERFAVAAQALGVEAGERLRPQGPAPARQSRDAVWCPAQRFRVGSSHAGWVPPAERGGEDIDVPAFEIDAQAVSWDRFVEFAEDGGYDRESLWTPAGWHWLQMEARRAPRYVEQLRGGAIAQRGGRLQKLAAGQAVAHVSWYEADAWCRWAGRRLPAEVEWELAACTATRRGWSWGDVWEWTGGTARAWPGGPALVETRIPRRVLRGASSWTVPRAAHPRQRWFVAPDRDELFCGFRSCSL